MFVFSFKATTAKILCAAVACIAIAVIAVSFMPDAGYAMNVNKIVSSGDISLKGIDSVEKQIELLSALGIEVEITPVQSGSVCVPKKFDAALEKYNELQKKQGFDLSKYRGKNVDRYTYKVKQHINSDSDADGNSTNGADGFYATLILYKNKVVGADICCPSTGEYSVVITP